MTIVGRSGRRPNKWLSLFLWLLPHSDFKTRALRRIGNDIGRDVVLGPTLVLNCARFSIGDEVHLGAFNAFKSLARIELGFKTVIGQWNQFTAAAGHQKYNESAGELVLTEWNIITNRHYFDCSGQLILEPYSGVGGSRCIFQTHEVDLTDWTTKVGRIVLGASSAVFTGCIVLKGAYLPDHSVLGAGSVLIKPKSQEAMASHGLYGGVPARYIQEIKDLGFWRRTSNYAEIVPSDDALQ